MYRRRTVRYEGERFGNENVWFGIEDKRYSFADERFNTEDLLFAASKNESISVTSFDSTFCPTVFKVSVGSSGFVFVSQIS